MKTRIAIASLVLVLVFLGLVKLGVFGNLGLDVGYFGEFNRVEDRLEAIEQVAIVDSWQHQDVTLEDFGFTLALPSGRRVELVFVGGGGPDRIFDSASGVAFSGVRPDGLDCGFLLQQGSLLETRLGGRFRNAEDVLRRMDAVLDIVDELRRSGGRQSLPTRLGGDWLEVWYEPQ